MLYDLIIFAIVFAVALGVTALIAGLLLMNVMTSKTYTKKLAERSKECINELMDYDDGEKQ